MSFNLVETGVPGEKPLQAKLRADYFSLSHRMECYMALLLFTDGANALA